MRAILLTAIIFGTLPFIFKRPWLGVLLWVLVSVMNPHRLTFGFGYEFPFAAIVAGVTILSGVFSKEPKHFPLTPVTVTLIAFIVWMNITTPFALNPGSEVFMMWNKVMKIFLMTFVTIWLLHSKRHVHLLIWVLVISVGYYGVKGGIWTLLRGGVDRVFGPAGSYIEDNNGLALALVMMIPLMYYLQVNAKQWWIRWGLLGAMLSCSVSVFGSYSRGAFLAIAAMAAFIWLKSRSKLALGLAIVLLIPAMIAFMPEKWEQRMQSIATPHEDSSASGRLVAWATMFNIAKDRPLMGSGFAGDTKEIWLRYTPDPSVSLIVAHSIYFQAMGEHGFVGLILYLLVLFTSWRTASWIIINTAGREEFRWALDLAKMIQVSLAGFMVGGAFLNLLYFDVTYYLIAALVVTRALVERELLSQPSLVTADRGARTAQQSTATDVTGAKG